jgi:hypothetical protein|tara:strand:- start:85 stop:360 length:276 start_codon:yes stop_codon:yes gene_type:complete
MIDTIKDFILNGMMTLKSLLTFEWINFKNWKAWTSLRMLYFMITIYMILGMIFGFFGGEIWCAMYFAICCFFKTEPIMWVLSKLGFSKTKI